MPIDNAEAAMLRRGKFVANYVIDPQAHEMIQEARALG
jgi:hypothetical protein